MTEPNATHMATLRNRLFDHAPRLVSAFTFLSGAIALVSAAIPTKTLAIAGPLQRVVSEAPIIGLTFGGIILMALSLGLARRLRTAWFLTIIATLHGILVTAAIRPRPIELMVYLGLLGLLIAARRAFYRQSSLQGIRYPRVWFLAAFLSVVVAGFFSLLWISHQNGFVEARFIDLIMDPVLGVAGRPVALALLCLAAWGFYIAVAQPLRIALTSPDEGDLERLSELFAHSDGPRPENVLAFAGDKSLFFGPDGDAALAYSESGGIRIAMGAPIGPKSAWKATLESFRKQAEADALRPAIYSATPELLPDLLDLSFTVEKIGESAILELPSFGLSGRKREVIRRGRRKLAERSGATFEMSNPPHTDGFLENLRPISDAWLNMTGAKEKSFSLGRFDTAFLNRGPLGLVRINGAPAAFGSLLTTPDKSWAGIDLMRYDPDIAITNTMDFLLVELILWAKEEGYQKFDLSMAPLSGLDQAEFAPLYARIGHFIYERGERFYNFRGLRKFKEKFDPVWEPRYVAAPGYWSLPFVLAQASRLTNNPSDTPEPAGSITLDGKRG